LTSWRGKEKDNILMSYEFCIIMKLF